MQLRLQQSGVPQQIVVGKSPLLPEHHTGVDDLTEPPSSRLPVRFDNSAMRSYIA